MLSQPDAIAALRRSGLRLTPQRRAVIDALAGDTSHPSADRIAAKVNATVPGISLSTVYNTLHEFAQIGLLLEIDLAGSMRFDPETSDHAHLYCNHCGKVSDVALSDALSADLARAAGSEAVTVTLRGICRDCAST